MWFEINDSGTLKLNHQLLGPYFRSGISLCNEGDAFVLLDIFSLVCPQLIQWIKIQLINWFYSGLNLFSGIFYMALKYRPCLVPKSLKENTKKRK